MKFVAVAKNLLMSILMVSAGGLAASADGWYEPERGTALRKDLMDALRPHAWWKLGQPVEFVINELRVSGDLAFAMVSPQRPGGGAINPSATPMVLRDGYMADDMDGVHMQALYAKSGNTWVVVEFSVGATEAWWAGSPFCAGWYPVIPEYCSGR